MDAEITLEKYCKKHKIDTEKFSDQKWEDLVEEFEEELDEYMRDCYDEGKFDMFLEQITGED